MAFLKNLLGQEKVSSADLVKQILGFEKQEADLRGKYSSLYQDNLDFQKRLITGQCTDAGAGANLQHEVLTMQTRLEALSQIQEELREALSTALEAELSRDLIQAGKDQAAAETKLIAAKRNFLSSMAAAVVAQQAYLGVILDQYIQDGRYPAIWQDLLATELTFYFAEIERIGSGSTPVNLFFEIDAVKEKKARLEQKTIGPADVDELLARHRGD